MSVTDGGRRSGLRTVHVPLADRSYDVLVGRGARHELASLVPPTVRRAAIVTQPGIGVEVDPGVPFDVFQIGTGEDHKHLGTVESLCRSFARVGLTRHDVVIGVGGGMVTDVAGFAAAVWHRGIPVVHVATTLLGMVDAAIGGKTGVNLPGGNGDGGKNLVGAFWQPSGVVCDLDLLATLPPRERRCGYGEMAKYHFLTGDDLLAMDETERIARCVQIKADVVAGDERKAVAGHCSTTGTRSPTRFEIETRHELAHGEAVAVGLVYAAHLAHVLGRIDDERVRQHYDVVGRAYELDTRLPDSVDHAQPLALMGKDKKALSGLTFVLDGPDGVEVVPGVSSEAVLRALDAMAAER
ncbi:MAG: 3-dehydroquinate synthase family protein [Ilumatobacteraceae bacterium]